MERQNDEVEIDLIEIFYLLRSKLLMIVLIAIIFALGSGVYTKYFVTPMYSSTASMYVFSKGSIASYSDLMAGTSLTSDYMELINSHTVMKTVLENLSLDDQYSVGQLKSIVGVSSPTDTRMLNITTVHPDPVIAKEIADEVANVSVEKIAEIMDIDKPNIYERGQIAENPISPNLKKNVLIAGILGAVITAAFFIIIYLIDDNIHSADDVEKYLKLETLASIPVETGSFEQIAADNRKRKKKEY